MDGTKPPIAEGLIPELKVLSLPPRQTLFPSVPDLIDAFRTYFDPIEDLWSYIRKVRRGVEWESALSKTGGAKLPLESIGIDYLVEFHEALSYFLDIDWSEIEKRMEGEDSDLNADLLLEEIIYPASDLMAEALDALKPPYLPGYFIVESTPDSGTMMNITYIEGENTYEAEYVYGESDVPFHPVAWFPED